MEEVIEKIKDIIVDISDISRDCINEDSAMIDDLDLSSVEILSIVADIENEFSIKITEDEMLEISTIKELANIIENTLRTSNYKRRIRYCYQQLLLLLFIR